MAEQTGTSISFPSKYHWYFKEKIWLKKDPKQREKQESTASVDQKMWGISSTQSVWGEGQKADLQRNEKLQHKIQIEAIAKGSKSS